MTLCVGWAFLSKQEDDTGWNRVGGQMTRFVGRDVLSENHKIWGETEHVDRGLFSLDGPF